MNHSAKSVCFSVYDFEYVLDMVEWSSDFVGL